MVIAISIKSFIEDRWFMIMKVYSTANLWYAKCDMTYERGNTSEIFYEQFVIKNAKSYFQWNISLQMVVKWMMWYRNEIIDEDKWDGSIANIFTEVSAIWKSSWILWYCLKFQLGFSMVESKVKNVQILMNLKIKFPWTCCKFEMGLLLTSSFEKKWKLANKTKQK